MLQVAITLWAEEGMTHIASMSSTETNLPLYWAWFVYEEDSTDIMAYSHKILAETLQNVPDFLSDVQNFTGHQNITDILNHYTRENADEVLHCTAQYNGVYPNYTDGALEYANKTIVKVIKYIFSKISITNKPCCIQENTNKDSVLHAIGWILTKRTFGARLLLKGNQSLLWNQDDNEGNNITNIRPGRKQKQNFDSRVITGVIRKENTTDQDPDVLGSIYIDNV